jgi:hypothetical protein
LTDLTPKARGEATAASVLAAFVSRGQAVSVPWGDNQPYDLIWDAGSKLYKVQVKTGKWYKEGIFFKTHSQRRDGSTVSYKDRADLFAVGYKQYLFLVPVSDAPGVGCMIGKKRPFHKYDFNTMLDTILGLPGT